MRIILLVIFFGLTVTKSIAQNDRQIFNFESDIRIFTVYAFFNASGFNHDWLEMHPLRIEIRAYLDSVLKDDYKLKIKAYNNRVGLNWAECGFYALHLEKAPSFNWIYDIKNIDLENKYIGLDTLLGEFFVKANVSVIWNKYKLLLDSINFSYEPYSIKALDDIVNFCGVKEDFYNDYAENIIFNVCPLMSHFQNFNYRVNKTLYLINGPGDGRPGPDVFYHEALHPSISPIIDKYKDLTTNYEKLNDCAQEKLKGNYPDIVSLLNESFVRTIDKYLVGQYYKFDSAKTRKKVEDEYKLGFIFCLYIYENIQKYLDSKKSLEEYYPTLMTNLNVDKEIERWKNYSRKDIK